jgi:hypothetical protein
MQYMLLIYLDEQVAAARSPSEVAAAVALHDPYIARLRANRRYAGSGVLRPTAHARTLRGGDGEPVATQGPFAESREQLGGFYVIEADDLDVAIEVAAECPALQTVAIAIEIRPVAHGALGDGGELVLARGTVPDAPGWLVLAEPGSATTLRLRDGKVELADGPFRDEPEPIAAARVVERWHGDATTTLEIRPLR